MSNGAASQGASPSKEISQGWSIHYIILVYRAKEIPQRPVGIWDALAVRRGWDINAVCDQIIELSLASNSLLVNQNFSLGMTSILIHNLKNF